MCDRLICDYFLAELERAGEVLPLRCFENIVVDMVVLWRGE